jgi:WD40 repeat protein
MTRMKRPFAVVIGAAVIVITVVLGVVGGGLSFGAVSLERHGELNLTVREVARWRPHWPNPVGYRQTLAIAWSPDGSKLAIAYNWGTRIKIIDPSGKELATAEVPNGPNITTSLAFLSGSSQVLYVGQETRSIKRDAFTLFDAQTGELLRTIPGPNPGHADLPNYARDFAVSPDGKLVVTTLYGGGPIIVYRTDNWNVIRRVDAISASAPIFLADSRRVIVSTLPSQFMVFDALDGTILRTFKVPETDDLNSTSLTSPRTTPAATIAISPDQKLAFAGTQWKFVTNERETIDPHGAAQVFQLTDGVRRAAFDLATPDIRRAAWDPNNRFVAFVDNGSHLFLWQPLARQMSYIKIDLPSSAWSLAISPDGFRIAVSSEGGVIIYEIR